VMQYDSPSAPERDQHDQSEHADGDSYSDTDTGTIAESPIAGIVTLEDVSWVPWSV
jgi:hypothetical protein